MLASKLLGLFGAASRGARLLRCAVFTMALASTLLAANAMSMRAVVDRAAHDFMATHPQALAMSIGVYHAGESRTFDYGNLDPGNRRAPSHGSLYPIASITKTFTGTLLAQAQIEGKLRLDDDVRRYLDGDFPNLEFEGQPVRLFDLLDHRSGLPFFIPDRPETRPDFVTDVPWATRIAAATSDYSREDFYADLHRVQLAARPGEAFRYSNAGATLAGYVLERVYQKPYETLLKEKIFEPLGLRETTLTLSESQEKHRVRGYRGDTAMPAEPDVLQGAGAIKSSVRDLLKYAVWHLRETDAAVKLSHQPVFTTGNYSAGLNWQILSAPGKRLIWQSGNFEGFHAYCILEPELGLAVVAMFNQVDPETAPAHGAMVNAILESIEPRAILMP